jgi:hypothetical protein
MIRYCKIEHLIPWRLREQKPLDIFIREVPHGLCFAVGPGLGAPNDLLRIGKAGGGMVAGTREARGVGEAKNARRVCSMRQAPGVDMPHSEWGPQPVDAWKQSFFSKAEGTIGRLSWAVTVFS